MVINFAILVLYRSNISNLSEDEDIHKLLTSMSNVKIINVTIANPIENIIMRKLSYMCDENEVDVIVVTGSVGHFERNFVIKTIKSICDRQVSEKTISLISNLETKLNETTFYRTICGVRNRTLMINLSGAYENSKKCLETVADMILNTAYIIRGDKNKNIFLCDNVIFSYNNSTDQEETNGAFKRRKLCCSSSNSFPTDWKMLHKDFPTKILSISYLAPQTHAILILERKKEEDLPESLPALLVDLPKNSIAWILINTFT